MVPEPLGPNWSLGRSSPIGPWAVRDQLVPVPFGPNWSLGRSSPIGPWAVRAQLVPVPFGPIGWACPCSRFHDPYAGSRDHNPYAGFRFHDPYLGFRFHDSYAGFRFHGSCPHSRFHDPCSWSRLRHARGLYFFGNKSPQSQTSLGGPGSGILRPMEAEGRLTGRLEAEPPGMSPLLAYFWLLAFMSVHG